MAKREIRFLKAQELRTETAADGKQYLTGHVATFGTLSEDLGGWRERIRPGAFARALKEQQDARHLINHDPNLVLGRVKAGTTELSEDAKGLHFRTLLGGRSYEKDLVESIERGDVNEGSFSFSVHGEAGQAWQGEIRELCDVDIFDISTVTYPAYPGTSAGIRSRALFPDGAPVEIRSRVPKADAGSDECECECPECQAGNCDLCSDPDCEDPFCDCASAEQLVEQHTQAAEREAALHSVNDGSPKPYFRAAVQQDGTLEIVIYEDIGYDFLSSGVTARKIKDQIDLAGPFSRICLRINSQGGDCFEGIAIYNLLRAQGKPIAVAVDGLAASAASMVAMAGDIRTMGPSSMMMVHNVTSWCNGYASDMRREADVIDKISLATAQTYSARTGRPLTEVQAMMDAETWMTAEECLANGFATAVVALPAAEQESAMVMARSFRALGRMKNVPERFKFVAGDSGEAEQVRRMRARLALVS